MMMYVELLEDGPEGKRLVRNICPLPLMEGKCPPAFNPETREWYYPEPVDYKDPVCVETDTYFVDGKEEYWGYVIHCKNCGTEFQAYISGGYVGNYCPGCGRNLIKTKGRRRWNEDH